MDPLRQINFEKILAACDHKAKGDEELIQQLSAKVRVVFGKPAIEDEEDLDQDGEKDGNLLRRTVDEVTEDNNNRMEARMMTELRAQHENVRAEVDTIASVLKRLHPQLYAEESARIAEEKLAPKRRTCVPPRAGPDVGDMEKSAGGS